MKGKDRTQWQVTLLAPVLSLVFLVVVWQAIVSLSQIHPVILPGPKAVWEAFQKNSTALQKGFIATGEAALVGMLSSLLIGSLIAVLFAQSRWLRAACFPYVIFLQTVPIVAIAPLLIIWSGYNFRTIVIVSFIISLFPVVSNVTSGLLSIDRNLMELFQLYGASRWQILFRLQIPAAIPNLILGARVSSGLAVIGAIVGEFFVGNGGQYDGLGTLMTGWQSLQRTDALIAAVLVSTLLGVSMFVLVNLISRTLLRRWTQAAGFDSNG